MKVTAIVGSLVGSFVNYVIYEWLFGNVVATFVAVFGFIFSLRLINKAESAHKRHSTYNNTKNQQAKYGNFTDTEVA